jgi:hypothetical protein
MVPGRGRVATREQAQGHAQPEKDANVLTAGDELRWVLTLLGVAQHVRAEYTARVGAGSVATSPRVRYHARVGGRCAGRGWGLTVSRPCPRPPSRRAWPYAGAAGRRRRTQTPWTWLRHNRPSPVSAAHARGVESRAKKRWAEGPRAGTWRATVRGWEEPSDSRAVCASNHASTPGPAAVPTQSRPVRPHVGTRASIGAPLDMHMLVRNGPGFFGYPCHCPDRARSRSHAAKQPRQPLSAMGLLVPRRDTPGEGGVWRLMAAHHIPLA